MPVQMGIRWQEMEELVQVIFSRSCMIIGSINRISVATVCPANHFICHNARCIPSLWECDSVDDCGDNSDEIHCSG